MTDPHTAPITRRAQGRLTRPSAAVSQRRRVRILGSLIGLGLLCVAASSVLAVGTARWRFDTADEFINGTLEGVRVTQDGALRPGFQRQDLGEFGKEIWCATVGPDDRIVFGTGSPATVQVVKDDDNVETLHSFDNEEVVAVTDLVFDSQGRLYIATMTGGIVLRLDPKQPDTIETFCELDEHYVWAMTFDAHGDLYVATGPEGKIYRITADGEAHEFYDADEANVLCLEWDHDGALLAGGSDGGRLYRVTEEGQATVIHQFAEQEIKALVRVGEDLYIGVNKQEGGAPSGSGTMPKPMPKPKPAPQPAVNPPQTTEEVQQAGTQPGTAVKPTMVRLPRPKKPVVLHGAVYRRDQADRYEPLMQQSKEPVLAMAAAAEGGVFVSLAGKARVYRVIDHDARELLFDLAEQQALSLATREGVLRFVGTGNAGTGYRIKPGLATAGTFTSQILDAHFQTQWGHAIWKPGPGVRLMTRSGNTHEPDASWSDWSEPGQQSPAQVGSPPARFLQLRAALDGQPTVRLDELQVYYRVRNQQPRITQLTIDKDRQTQAATGKSKKPSTTAAKKPSGGAKPANSESMAPFEASTTRKLEWTASDRDGDRLVYRLAYRAQESERWVSMPEDKPLTKNAYEWKTESVADGWYRLRVTASDEESNPAGEALTAEKISDPIVVDNRRPQVNDLQFDIGNQSVRGRAADALSTIASLEYAIDGDEWTAFAPEDGIFDETEETFEQTLDLEPGPHYLAIRVTDAQGNIGVVHLDVDGQ